MIGLIVFFAAVVLAMGDVLSADAWIWFDVAATEPIDHAVMVRGSFDEAHRKLQLAGPVAVTAAAEDAGPCYSVYAATVRDDEPPQAVRAGKMDEPLRLGPPAFLLIPARRLQDGAPATEPPRGVYEIRPVLGPPAVLAGGPEAAGPPAYIGLPVDYRHHFERVAAEAADRGLVIFSSRDLPQGGAPAAVADDLGIARLTPRGTGRTAAWLPVQPTPKSGRPADRP